MPIGREIGTLRGIASALLVFLSRDDNGEPLDHSRPFLGEGHIGAPETERPEARAQTQLGPMDMRTEVTEIVRGLANVQPASLIPPDVEAIEHAKEHGKGDEDVGKLVELDAAERERERKIQEVETLKARLKQVLHVLGLDIDL